jgi:hypothetical protein
MDDAALSGGGLNSMATMGKTEKAFCKYHGIPDARSFDATGLSKSECYEAMKLLEKWVAFGVEPCPNGHRLKNKRQRNCLICHPASLAWIFRSEAPGYLYIARSKMIGHFKAGFSNDPHNRLYIANCEGWGGASDWQLVSKAWDEKAGSKEFDLHRRLSVHRSPRAWVRNGKSIKTREAYACSMDEAIEALVLTADGFPQSE